jgi:membrane protein implicated in regulation of membrane protease activity
VIRLLTNGPPGFLLILIGAALAIGAGWVALGSDRWAEEIPLLLIGLALVSFGWSIVNRTRKRHRT